MSICADDYVVIEPGDPVVAHAFVSTGKLSSGSVDRLGLDRNEIPDYQGALDRGEKFVLGLDTIAPGRLVPELEVVAVIVPEVGSLDKPQVTSMAAPQTMRHFAPSTVIQQSTHGRDSLRVMAQISRAVPGFRLGLTTDDQLNAAAVREVIESVRSR